MAATVTPIPHRCWGQSVHRYEEPRMHGSVNRGTARIRLFAWGFANRATGGRGAQLRTGPSFVYSLAGY